MKILVCGAGIAGTAATLFLRKSGHDVVTIEKAPSFRPLGYVLSLKYFGLALMKSLGLLDELRCYGIPYTVMQVRDARGAVLQEYPEALAEKATKGSIFLLRSDLHRVLYEAVSRDAPVRLGTYLSSIAEDGEGVSVTYAGGGAERFDLVVVAEGLRSSSRALLLGNQGLRLFDVIYTATLVDGRHEVPDRIYQIYLGSGTSMLILPINDQRLMIQCYFRGVLRSQAPNEQVNGLLRDACRRFPERLRDTIDRIAESEYIFADQIGMVVLPELYCGRVAFLGDAGYCPTFLSGMGASLALLGAKALDQSLHQSADDVPDALAGFNRLMQPVIAHYQRNAYSNVDLVLTRNPFRAMLQRWVMRVFPPAMVARQLGHQHDLETSLLCGFGALET